MIQDFETIIIHRHERPDPDAIASQCGLKKILQASFPPKKIYAVGSFNDSLKFLARMDKKVNDEVYQDALVIVVDTADVARISDERFAKGKKLIKIDHHPNDDIYGDLLWVEPTVSSTSELIVHFYLTFKNKLKMTTEAARLLYAGIVGDTGRFLYPATTAKTLEIASFLLTFPFNASLISRELSTISMKVAKLSGYVYQNISVDENGAAYVLLSTKILQSYNVAEFETSAIVSLPGMIDEVLSWVIFVEKAEGGFRARLRSKGPTINEIAKRYNGGGHLLASGANAKNHEEVQKIYREIQDVAQKWRNKQ
jgi:phosphoesterase RecJ-like protein